MRGRSMKKASRQAPDDLRPEYKRSDFDSLERGKYAARLAPCAVFFAPKSGTQYKRTFPITSTPR